MLYEGLQGYFYPYKEACDWTPSTNGGIWKKWWLESETRMRMFEELLLKIAGVLKCQKLVSAAQKGTGTRVLSI